MKPSRPFTILVVALLFVAPALAKPAKGKAAGASRCSLPHYPIAVGDVNEYRMTSNQLDGEKKIIGTTTSTYSEEVIEVLDDSFIVKSVSEGNSSESTWNCSDKGLELKLGEFPDTKITPIGVTIPRSMEVGGTWDQGFEMTTIGMTQKSKTVNRITKREKVVVEAGTFDAFRVEFESESASGDEPPSLSGGTQWYALGVGLVKTISYIAMESGDIRRIETTSELVKRTTK